MLGFYHYLVLGLFAAFALIDFAARARRFPSVRLWRARGFASLLLYLGIATFAPLLWDGALGEYRLIDATGLPFPAQILGGFLALELGSYAWHRAMHETRFLWRWFHQMHHSAERIDVWGAFYFSPLDMIGWAFLGSFVLVLGFGVSGEAAVAIGLISSFLSMFQHANISTPHWLGYLIVRPESHTLHHERGVHAFNYSDLPLWDMLFGTFRNPRRWKGEAGFYEGASNRIGAMLIGKEIA